MRLDSLDLQLQQFERIDATSATALLRLKAGWRANHERRLSPPVLLICDERRTHRIAALPGPDDAAPVAGPDAPGWRGAYSAPIELVEQSSATFAIDTGRGVFALPRPTGRADRATSGTLEDADESPKIDMVRQLTERNRQLERHIAALADASATATRDLRASQQAALQAQREQQAQSAARDAAISQLQDAVTSHERDQVALAVLRDQARAHADTTAAELKSANERAAELTTQLDESTAELHDVRADRDRALARADTTAAELKSANEQAAEEVQRVTAERDQAIVHVRRLETEASVLETANDDLTATISGLRDQVGGLGRRATELEGELTAAKSHGESADAATVEAREQLVALQAQHDEKFASLNAHQQERERDQAASLALVEQQRDAARTSATALVAKVAEMRDTVKHVAALRMQNEQLVKRAESAEASLAGTSEALRAARASLDDVNVAHDATMRDLKEQLAIRADAQEVVAKTRAALEAEVQAHGEATRRLDLAHDEHAAHLQREETARAELGARLMESAEHTTELEEQLRLTISGAAEASASLADELAVSRREQAAVQAQLDAARAQDEDARAELDPIRTQLHSLRAELEAAHVDREGQQARLAAVFEQHRDLATRLDEMATERDREHAEKIRLRDELSARLVAMENERDAAQEELAQIAGQRREEVRARKQAAERLEHVVRQHEQLTLCLAESTAAADAARREAATAEDAVARLQRRIAELEEAELQAPAPAF